MSEDRSGPPAIVPPGSAHTSGRGTAHSALLTPLPETPASGLSPNWLSWYLGSDAGEGGAKTCTVWRALISKASAPPPRGGSTTSLPGGHWGFRGDWGSTESLSHTHWGTDQARAHFGVTFTKKGLFWEWKGGASMNMQEDTPPTHLLTPAPNPSSHQLAKLRTASRRGASGVRKQIPCYICMTIFLYFSEQTSVVYVPVCPDSPAPLPAAPLLPHPLYCDLTSSS